MKEIYDIIQELRANNSANYKLSVLEKYKDNEGLKKFLTYVYNPRWNYYLTKLPEDDLSIHNAKYLDEESFYTPLDKLKDRELTGNSAKDMFSYHLAFCGAELLHLYELVIARDIKANVSVKSINKVFPNLIQETPYQRCSTLDKGNIDKIFEKDFAYVQLKADGIFSYIIKQDDKVKLLTRNGTEWESELLTNRMQYFPNGMVLLGEALIQLDDEKELDRKTGNGRITSFAKRYQTLDSLQEKIEKAKGKALFKLEDKLKDNIAEWYETANNLRFDVWDILYLEEFEQGFSDRPYHTRLNELEYLVAKSSVKPYIQVIETHKVETLDEAMQYANLKMEQGYEGAILKAMDVLWENKTSKVMVKIKAEKDIDLICTDVQEGTGKYEGMIGSLICESSCGRLKVRVGTGLDDNDRSKSPDEYIGKILTIGYNQLSDNKANDNYSLFLPKFIEVRIDKTEADSLEDIK